MSGDSLMGRIVSSPEVMAGKPVIKGTRLTIEYILNLLAHGASKQEILSEYVSLTPEDIRACYLFTNK